MKNNYVEHPWLKGYPILPEHKYLIIGTHPPMPYSGCMPFYYGNMNEFWRLLEEAYNEELFFNYNGTPALGKILTWLESKKLAITDMVNYTLKDNKFSTDQKMIFENYSCQLNQHLKNWLEEGNIETIFFTSFSEGKSAYGLFKKWVKMNFSIRMKSGKEIIDNGNEEYIVINGKRIRTVMLYSPSPAARRGIPRSQPYIQWLEKNKNLENPIDLFRVDWYRKFIMKTIENN
jgi:G:T/U-mismatch repair DNA glycosylase